MTLSSSEYHERLKSERNPDYSSTFSGYHPKGASDFSQNIHTSMVLNSRREIELRPGVLNQYSSSYDQVIYYRKGQQNIVNIESSVKGTISNSPVHGATVELIMINRDGKFVRNEDGSIKVISSTKSENGKFSMDLLFHNIEKDENQLFCFLASNSDDLLRKS